MKTKKTNKFSTFKKRKPHERKVADSLVKTHERNEKLRQHARKNAIAKIILPLN